MIFGVGRRFYLPAFIISNLMPMRPLLLFGLLCSAAPALAQQPDTLAPRRAAAPVTTDTVVSSFRDTQRIIVITDPVGVDTTSYHPFYLPTPTILPYLTQIAGVQVTPYSGAPGTGAVVRIRGVASVDNNVQPLYVVDGVPVMQYRFTSRGRSDASSTRISSLNPDPSSNPLLSIAPEDIEQIEVLKGAFETGRYGFLGQNGVVRITTKRGGVAQPLRVRYTGYGGVQQARTRYKLLEANEIAVVANEANRNNGYPPQYMFAEVAAFGRGTDWQDEILRTAALQEHHLSAAGGTKFGTRYYAAANYLQQNGIVLNSNLQRYGLRLTVEQQLGKRLQLSGGINFSETQVRWPTTIFFGQLFQNTLRYLPTIPVYAANGDYAADDYYINPVQRARQNFSTSRNRRLLATAQLQYQPATGLTVEVRSSLERDSLLARYYQSPRETFTRTAGQLQQLQRASYQQWVLNPAVRYARTFAAWHSVKTSVEASFYDRKQSEGFAQYSYLAAPGGYNVPPRGVSTQEYTAQQTYLSYNAQVGYTYHGRYQVQASIQRGTSPLLPPSDATQWLPAAQATWHAGQEPWVQRHPVVNTLDAWVRWGKTSNRVNFTGSHGLTYPSPGGGSFFLFGDELTTQLDAGLHLALWQDRFSLRGEVYRRKTDVQLGYPQSDQGNVLNSGVELALAGSWQAGRLSGVSQLAGALNQNRYTKPAGTPTVDYRPSSFFVLQDGQPLSSFIGYRYLGVDSNGNRVFRQDASNPSGREQVILGSGLPRQSVNFTQTLRYKRLELQTQLDGLFGYQVFDTNLSLLDVPINGFNATTRVRDRWTPTNTNTQVPRAGTGASDFDLPTTYTLQSGNNFRVSVVTLSATVWQRQPHSVSVFVSGTNLLVLSGYRGYDPNVSANEADPLQAGLDTAYYPTARTFLLGVRATL